MLWFCKRLISKMNDLFSKKLIVNSYKIDNQETKSFKNSFLKRYTILLNTITHYFTSVERAGAHTTPDSACRMND